MLQRAIFVAIALAPQASSNAAGYRRAVDTALAELGDGAPTVEYVSSWHDQPRFIEALAQKGFKLVDRGRLRRLIWIVGRRSDPRQRRR